MNTSNSPAHSRYLVLLGAIIIQLILGTVYGYSIFWQPLTSEIFPPIITEAKQAEMIAAGQSTEGLAVVADAPAAQRLLTMQQGRLKYAFAICILSFAVVMVIAGRVQDLLGPRIPAMIGGILMGGGFLVAGMMGSPIAFYIAHAAFAGALCIVLLKLFHAASAKFDPKEVPIVQYIPMGIMTSVIVAAVLLGNTYVGQQGEQDKLFLLWGTVGFMAGAGVGFAYVCPIAALLKWFPKSRGLISGIVVAGFGFGAYIFSHPRLFFSAENYIKNHGVAQLFVIHGLVTIVAIVIGALLLRNPPGFATAPSHGDSAWQDTLRRPAFWVLWLMYFSGALAGLMVIGIVKPFASEQLVTAAKTAGQSLADTDLVQLGKTAAAAVGWLAIFNALGRIFWGFVSDRVGRTPAFIANFLFQAVVMFILGGLNTPVSLAVGASLVGFNYGGCFALFPSATADLFGAKNIGANYGWLFTSYGIAGVVGVAAGNLAKQITGQYNYAFSLAAILCIISAGLAVGLAVTRKRAAASAGALNLESPMGAGVSK